MNDSFVEKLRREAALPPPAPAREWESIASRSIQRAGLPDRWRKPLLGLGGALALASALFIMVTPRAVDHGESDAALEEYLSEAKLSLGRSAEAAPGEKFLALVEGAN